MRYACRWAHGSATRDLKGGASTAMPLESIKTMLEALKTGLEKIWKEKEPCVYYVKKHAFMLGPDLYQECKQRFRRKKQNCKNLNVLFDVEFDDIEWPTHCPVLGIELDYYGMLGSRNPASVSFDRIDSSIGYIPGNVHIISWKANRIKNDGTAEEHRKIADYIDKYLSNDS